MGRHEKPIRLRESAAIFPPDTPVIDVQFTEVGGKRRTLWGRVKVGLQALLWAVVVGLLIPPAWMLIQAIVETIGPR